MYDDDSDWGEEEDESGESTDEPGWVCKKCDEGGELVLCDSCHEVSFCWKCWCAISDMYQL